MRGRRARFDLLAVVTDQRSEGGQEAVWPLGSLLPGAVAELDPDQVLVDGPGERRLSIGHAEQDIADAAHSRDRGVLAVLIRHRPPAVLVDQHCRALTRS